MKATDTLVVDMKVADADLRDAARLPDSMVERHAVVRSMAEPGSMAVAAPIVVAGPAADAGNGKLEI